MEDQDESKHSTDVSDDEAEDVLPHYATASLSARMVATPDDMDIICGRGKSVAHPGNQRFRELVLARKDEYQQAKRLDDKTRITAEVVAELRSVSRPSRFLLRDPKSKKYYDVGDVYAKEKVSHALRSRPSEERRKRPKPKKKTSRKPKISPELEAVVQKLIQDQQELLKEMIKKEVFPEVLPKEATVENVSM